MTDKGINVLARNAGLRVVSADDLSIRREANGEGWRYVGKRKNKIRDRRVIERLNRLAVPPAYTNVRYAQQPRAHLQAVGEDSAGRLQYVYHRDWTKVRELRKAKRLMQLSQLLPRIRRTIATRLGGEALTREFVLACVIELIAASAIRAGSEEYARTNRTRGAATLLKSNVAIDGGRITLTFRAKGGKFIKKDFKHRRLAKAISRLTKLPGRRLFQYRDDAETVRAVTAREVNTYLKELAGSDISLKDFRTLCATVEVLKKLARQEPAESAAGRKKQIVEALKSAADTLENTVTVCRTSYVHPAIITAFETGALKSFTSRSNHTLATLIKAESGAN